MTSSRLNMPTTWLPVITGSWLTPSRSICWRAVHSSAARVRAFRLLQGKHDLGRTCRCPVRPWHFLDPVQGHQANGIRSALDEEAAAAAAQNVFIHELLQRQVRRDGCTVTAHGLRNRVTRQQTLKYHLMHLRRGGIVEKPADEGDP